MDLQPNEIRDITRLLEQGKPLPDKYRFMLFDDKRQVELVWNGKSEEVTNVVLPFQTIEHIDEPREEGEKIKLQKSLFDTSGRQIAGWTNKLIWGDNKLILSALKNGPLRKEIEDAGGVKLIYIDPPFDVGADFSIDIEIGEEQFTKKPSVIEDIAYRDTWGKGADSFIAMIFERIKLMHGLLADDGAIYVHCDWRVSAYIRLVLDEVFGKENFRNEIAWHYPSMSRSNRFFPRKHDSIFFFAKSDKYIFNAEDENLREKYAESTVARSQYAAGFSNTEANYLKSDTKLADTIWTISHLKGGENIGYPTQKPEKLIRRIVSASTNPGDLVADFFIGSGTMAAVAEKLGRKWIGSDLGRFGIHTARKRMINVQRELKKDGKNYRAFEILNLGKYERRQFTKIDGGVRAEEKEALLRKKEDDFKSLILSAYKAEPVSGLRNFVGKKRDRLVAVGPIEFPVTNSFVQAVIDECCEKGIAKVDMLGFDWEMGLDLSEARRCGVDIQFKTIPNEVFDKRAVERGQVRFFDVAFIEAKATTKKNSVSIELSNFSVFYNQEDIAEVEENLERGVTRIILDNGNIIKLSRDKKTDLVTREVLTKKWTDWVDYWAVDFNYENKKEVVKSAEGKEEWTGQYIFENEWQSFRTKKDRELELKTPFMEVGKGRIKVAVKVIDIFGNDTTKIIEVTV